MKENAEGERNFQRRSFPHRIDKNINTYILSVGQYGSSHPKETEDVDNERRLEGEDLRPLGSDNPINPSPGSYNASADLFDNAEEILGETLQSEHRRSLKGRHGMEVGSVQTPPPWESPCTHVIVRRNSQLQRSNWQEVHEGGTIHGLLSCLQSTPILRPLSESSVHTGDGYINRESRTSVLPRRSGRHSLTNLLLRNIKQSLLRGSSDVFCTISDHFRFYSPITAEMSCCQVLQRRKSIKSGKKKRILEEKERRSIRRWNGRSGEDGGDNRMVTRHDRMDDTDIGGTASPRMSPFHVTVPLPGDWSPELFTEKSDISKQSDTLQRRLF